MGDINKQQEQLVKVGDIRKEVYDYIQKEILPEKYDMKKWNKNHKELSKILKKFSILLNPINPEKKDKKPFIKPKRERISASEQKNKDLKNGIWRPNEFYNF